MIGTKRFAVAFLSITALAATLTTTFGNTIQAETHCPGNVASLPFRLVNGYEIVVAVSIDRTGPYDFLLDTGTQTTIVGPSLAAELHLSPKGAAVVAGAGYRNPASYAQIGRLEAGSQAVAGQKILVYDLLNLKSVDRRIRGILGQDFLERFDVLIDYERKMLCLDDSGVMREEVKGARIALVTPTQEADGAGLPALAIVEARLSGEPKPVRMMVDSGANILMLFHTSRRVTVKLSSQASFEGSGGNGVQQALLPLPAEDMEIGSIKIPGITFVTLAETQKGFKVGGFDGVLTTALFRRVFLDNAEHFVVLDPR